jgi:hypothetical protein
MNLDEIWNMFIPKVNRLPGILNVRKKEVTGIPFLYVEKKNDINPIQLEDLLAKCAMVCMKGKRLNFEIQFVRTEEQTEIFRARFLVPQEKMFCCGNLCENCILHKQKKPE